MINFLTDDFPKEIMGFKIRTDFRVWILFETYLQSPLNALTQIANDLVDMIFIEKPHDYSAAFFEVIRFKSMYIDSVDSGKQQEPLFDWVQDGAKVYSAFMRVYSINLRTIEYLHWWEFMALFNDLGERCELMEAISYRSLDITEIQDNKERSRLNKIKSHYELR